MINHNHLITRSNAKRELKRIIKVLYFDNYQWEEYFGTDNEFSVLVHTGGSKAVSRI